MDDYFSSYFFFMAFIIHINCFEFTFIKSVTDMLKQWKTQDEYDNDENDDDHDWMADWPQK